MLRILFLPFLRIPSGHHHAAESIRAELENINLTCHFEKVDILSYSYGRAEKWVSSVYLSWIHKFPNIYSTVYKIVSLRERKINKRFYLYEWLFLNKMKQLILETNPDIIICTHALPSYLIARLKKNMDWTGTVINVYTDYFVNQLWGRDGIDYHFVPSIFSKEDLLVRGVKPEQMIATGIPVHPIFRKEKESSQKTNQYTVLISGGNMGAGSIHRLLKRLIPSGAISYKVLCGKNKKLYQDVEHLNHPNIEAIDYISNKQEMNFLYNQADAMITKPGGITVTECLWKKIPIIVYEALPGQEEMNLHYLRNEKLIYFLNNWDVSKNVEKMILDILKDRLRLEQQLNRFKNCIEKKDVSQFIKKIHQGRERTSN